MRQISFLPFPFLPAFITAAVVSSDGKYLAVVAATKAPDSKDHKVIHRCSAHFLHVLGALLLSDAALSAVAAAIRKAAMPPWPDCCSESLAFMVAA